MEGESGSIGKVGRKRSLHSGGRVWKRMDPQLISAEVLQCIALLIGSALLCDLVLLE